MKIGLSKIWLLFFLHFGLIGNIFALEITQQPTDAFVCFPDDAVFTIEATGVDTYTWYGSNSYGSGYVEITGDPPYQIDTAVNNSSCTLTVDISDPGSNPYYTYYYCEIYFNDDTKITDDSDIVSIFVYNSGPPGPPPEPSGISEICIGSTTEYTVTFADASEFEWELSENDIGDITLDGNNNDTIWINWIDSFVDIELTVKGKNPCSPNWGTPSDPLNIDIYEDLEAIIINEDTSICTNTIPNTLYADVSGGSTNYSYLWEYSTNGGSSWLTAGTDPSLVFVDELTITTQYRLTVNDGDICGPVTDDGITITVFDLLIVDIINEDTSICTNTIPNTLYADVSGGSLSYTYIWEYSTDGGSTWLTAGTDPSLVFVDELTSTTQYRLTVNDGDICGPVTDDGITITVFDLLVVDIINEDTSICTNTIPNTLYADVSGGSLSYTYIWEYSTDGGSSWLTAGTDPSLVFVDELTITTQYRLTVNDGDICGPVTDDGITITVFDLLVVDIINEDTSICTNTIPNTLYADVSGGSLSYTYIWEYSTDGGSSWLTAGTDPSLVFVDELTITTQYRLTVNDGDICGPVTDDGITITVFDLLVVDIINEDTSICTNTIPNTLYADVSGGSLSYTYIWEYSTDGGSSWLTAGTDPSLVFVDELTITTQYRLTVNDGDICGPVTSTFIEIEVEDEKPVSIVIALENDTICEGEVTICYASPVNGGDSPVYYWQVNNTIVDSTSETTYTFQNLSNGDMVSCELKSSLYLCSK